MHLPRPRALGNALPYLQAERDGLIRKVGYRMKTALWIIALCKLFELFVAIASATAQFAMKHKKEREAKERMEKVERFNKAMKDSSRYGSI